MVEAVSQLAYKHLIIACSPAVNFDFRALASLRFLRSMHACMLAHSIIKEIMFLFVSFSSMIGRYRADY